MYIPSIPSTLINFLDIPDCVVSGELVDMRHNIAYRLTELEDISGDVVKCKIPLVRVNTRLYTADRLIPSGDSCQSIEYDLKSPIVQRIVSDEPTHLLWHGRLGHINF